MQGIVDGGWWMVDGGLDQSGGGEAGIGGGRCGGCPPAQGRAEGPTAQIDTHPWRRVPIVGMSQA